MEFISLIIVALTLAFWVCLECVSQRTHQLKRRLEKLEARLTQVERLLDAEDDDDKGGLEGRKRVALFYLIVVIGAMCSAIYVYGAYGVEKKKDLAEFVSYVLPSIAGVIGGLGLYYRDKLRVEIFFWVSGLLIGLGLVAFFLSKPTVAPFIGTITLGCVAVIMSSTFLAIDRRRRDCLFPTGLWPRTKTAIGVVLLFMSFAVLALGFVYPDVIVHANDWQSRTPIHKAVFQLVMRLEHLRQL